MHNITIRKAHPNDLEKLLEFEQGIIATERPFDPTLKPEKIHYYDIKKMISEPHIEVLVAEIDSELIGSGYARIATAKPYLNHLNYFGVTRPSGRNILITRICDFSACVSRYC